jgi:hypothetical protein
VCPFAKIKQNTRDGVPCQTGIRTCACGIHETIIEGKKGFFPGLCYNPPSMLDFPRFGADVETAI